MPSWRRRTVDPPGPARAPRSLGRFPWFLLSRSPVLACNESCSPGHAEAADRRQLERRMPDVQAEGEAEEVQLEPFLPSDQETGEAEERELKTGAARGEPCERAAGEIVLADGRRREIEPQRGDGAADIGGERVAVRARPGAVARGVGIGRHRRLDLGDELVRALAPTIDEEVRAAAEPVVVGSCAVDADRRRPPV